MPVPELNYPMYTAAMMGLVVTSSGLDKTQKERIKLLVERMAGVYSAALHDGVSHLVTVKALSQKYNVAVKKEVPVMLPAWLEEIWRASATSVVTAHDNRFSHLKCRPMEGVRVSVSQLDKNDKNLIQKAVETHGGSYSGVLEMEKTTVLVSLVSEN